MPIYKAISTSAGYTVLKTRCVCTGCIRREGLVSTQSKLLAAVYHSGALSVEQITESTSEKTKAEGIVGDWCRDDSKAIRCLIDVNFLTD
jgi:hypothetical protein